MQVLLTETCSVHIVRCSLIDYKLEITISAGNHQIVSLIFSIATKNQVMNKQGVALICMCTYQYMRSQNL